MSSNEESIAQHSTATPHRLPITKLTAVTRLKSFTESLVSRKPKLSPTIFPPPSWNIDDFNPNWVIEQSRPVADDAQTSDTAPAPSTSVAEETVEPLTFARKLRAMIELLPIPGTFTTASTVETATPSDDKPGSPVPPGIDEGLVQMLSSEDLMNGDRDRGTNVEGKARQSVWNILASLGHSNKERKGEVVTKNSAPTVEEEENGVMMYAPLEPSPNSQVRLAESETVLEYVDEPQDSKGLTQTSVGKSKKRHSSSSSDEDLKTVEKRIWVPSTTQLSVLTTWWGYRLYLPPPVMAKLGTTSIKAAARAAMITGALKWLLDKIPLMLVPPQFRPAVSMLKRLSPVVGYVGVFIAWSWDRICTLDEGNGVVLTATWLLPVALMPMSWDAGEIYGPQTQPKEVESDPSSPKKGKHKEKKKSRFLW